MIDFYYETEFQLKEQDLLTEWITEVVSREGFELGEVSFTFCDDQFLHRLNLEFLGHDTLTDIISFDYRLGKQISGEIFISVNRVAENAKEYNVAFDKELHRVMIHGILHYCGYKDKQDDEERLMREKEDWALSILCVDYPEN